jgi:hypothetical protein
MQWGCTAYMHVRPLASCLTAAQWMSKKFHAGDLQQNYNANLNLVRIYSFLINPTFLAVFKNTISVALFNYCKLRALFSMFTLLTMVTNCGTH